MIPQMLGMGAGILLVLGLWTPVAGVVIAIVEAWIALSGTCDPLIPVLLGTLGATLAIIGPGAWSIDARLFGRKHIEV
jgi:putative oxidoreductase